MLMDCLAAESMTAIKVPPAIPFARLSFQPDQIQTRCVTPATDTLSAGRVRSFGPDKRLPHFRRQNSRFYRR